MDAIDIRTCVHQIPFSVLFAHFPELKSIWSPLHTQWKTLRAERTWCSHFQESLDEEQIELFRETRESPDVEKYQRLERLGQEEREARDLGNGWVLNRGKIAYTRLAWLPSFEQRGVFWYPKGGYREWHSNFPYNIGTDRAGWRIYLVDIEEEGLSGFQYLDEHGSVVHCADRKGYANIFWLPHDRFFWHAVFSETDRFSCGFHPVRHLDGAMQQLLLSSARL